jgi:hypothetical protein
MPKETTVYFQPFTGLRRVVGNYDGGKGRGIMKHFFRIMPNLALIRGMDIIHSG